MTAGMSHDEAFSALEAAALGALTEQEERDVALHAATCKECGPALVALREAGAQLAYAAPAASMAPACPAMRARLVERAKRDKTVSIIAPFLTSKVAARGDPRSSSSASGLAWLAVAAGVAFVVSSTLLAITWRDRTRLQTSLADLTASQSAMSARVDSVQAALAADERTLLAIGGPRVRVVNLTSSGNGQPVGRMFWDQATNRWTLFAHFLPAPKEGRTYQLWLVSKGAKISAGTFTPDSSGEAIVRAEFALASNALDAIAVTEEPDGGVAAPTGLVVLGGSGK